MKKCFAVMTGLLLLVFHASGLEKTMQLPEKMEPQKPFLPLYPDRPAPGAFHGSQKPFVDMPVYAVYDNTGERTQEKRPAIVIFPGGGYHAWSQREWQDYSRFLNQYGIVCMAVLYRNKKTGYSYPAPLNDGLRAIRFLRANAEKFNVDKHRIGVMGSSAGGHLAAMCLVDGADGDPASSDPVERESAKPDFGILVYPVIRMDATSGHRGSRLNLVGSNASDELLKKVSPAGKVTAKTAPCALFHGKNDKTVKYGDSETFAAALKKANVPHELHLYDNMPHGTCLGAKYPYAAPHPWVADLLVWLEKNHFTGSRGR